MCSEFLLVHPCMLYELIEKRLANVLALMWDCEFQKAYTELDLLLRMYPDDLRVHDAYASVIQFEVYQFSEDYGPSDEKLRKARKHNYYVIRHCTDAQSRYMFRALSGLAFQAEAFEKKRHKIRLNRIISELYGQRHWELSQGVGDDTEHAEL